MNYDLGKYTQTINNLSNHIKSFESYQSCVKYLFSDEKFNYGKIKVWFHFTKHLYPRLSAEEQNQINRYVLQCFSLFEIKCGEYGNHIFHMKEDWDVFKSLYKM